MRTIRRLFASSFILVGSSLAACGGQTSGAGSGLGSASLSGSVGNTTFTVASVVAVIGPAASSTTCSSVPDSGQTCTSMGGGQVVLVGLTNRADATCDFIQSEAASGTQTQLANFDVLQLAVGSQTEVAPGTYAVSAAVGSPTGAYAELQTSTASCTMDKPAAATSGTITLTQAGPGEVAGSYSVTFGAQGTLTGSFDVAVCNVPDAGTVSTSSEAGAPVCKQ